MKTIIEPFKIKMVEPIRLTTPEQRNEILRTAHFNPFQIKAEDVLIDLLTDSGTSAMSNAQWAGMLRADESYAGARSWYHFESVLLELTGMPHILPTHQGRASERILFELVGGPGKVIPGNNHFDTTREYREIRTEPSTSSSTKDSSPAHATRSKGTSTQLSSKSSSPTSAPNEYRFA